MGVPEHPAPTYRYREFPELFWDARPNELIDPENPIVLARVLTQGSADAIAKLVRPDALERLLPTLVIPEHSRRFWKIVLEEFQRPRQEEPACFGAGMRMDGAGGSQAGVEGGNAAVTRLERGRVRSAAGPAPDGPP